MKVVACLLFLCVPASIGIIRQAAAQQPDSLLEQIRQAYQQLDYELAEERASTALVYSDQFSNAQLAEIHTTLGLVNYAQNELEAARQQFESALILAPGLTLDPQLVSPKILDFFEEVRQDVEAQRSTQPVLPQPSIRYVQLVDTKVAATLRSVVLPGWGQLYKGQQTKGVLLASAWTVTGAGAVISYAQREHVESRIEDADNQSELEELEGQHDSWRRRHRNFMIGAAGIWLYSYLDALLSDTPLPYFQAAQGLSVSAHPNVNALHVRWRYTF